MAFVLNQDMRSFDVAVSITIKFKVGETIGLRAGFEDIDDRLAPQ